MTQVVPPADPALLRLLSGHPFVTFVSGSCGLGELVFGERSLVVGDPSCEVSGLVELTDNNPLVCASRASVPGAVATLGLIAFGPLARAGLLVDSPVMQVAGAEDDGTLSEFLGREGWGGGVAVSVGDEEFGSVVAANCVAEVSCSYDEVVELFRESYGRSFFVRECSSGQWDVALVAGRPFACYRLSSRGSLVTMQVMGDRDGKCGAAQVVHVFNVMCGYEESLGCE